MGSDSKGQSERNCCSFEEAPLISVIVPVYNADDYLEKCLQSLLGQTYPSLEFIAINDGSTDDSLETLRRYEAADPRIRVIDKPNAGYGHSVNCGLDAATGYFVSIVEPDDIVSKNMYAALISAAHCANEAPPDVVKGSYWNYFAPDGAKPYAEASNLMNCMPKEISEISIRNNCEVLYHHPSIWSALYRTDFLRESNIRMIEPPGAGWADNPFFFETMLQAKSILWTPYPVYYYRQDNPNASSKQLSYQLPFERMRDLRAIYRRLNITDATLLGCLYHREFSYMKSLLEKFRYPDTDSQFHELILETLDTMNSDIVFSSVRGMNADFQGFYRDYTGISAASFSEHSAPEKALVTVICIFENDRPYIARHLKGWAEQTAKEFEVLCISLNSNDLSAELIGSIAGRDKRFKLLKDTPNSYGEAIQLAAKAADGNRLVIADMKRAYPKNYLEKLRDHDCSNLNADLLLLQSKNASGDAPDTPSALQLMEDAHTTVHDIAPRAELARMTVFEQSPCSFGKATLDELLLNASSIACASLPASMPLPYRSFAGRLAGGAVTPAFYKTRQREFDAIANIFERSHIPEQHAVFRRYFIAATFADLEALRSRDDIHRYLHETRRIVAERDVFRSLGGNADEAKQALDLMKLIEQDDEFFFVQRCRAKERICTKLERQLTSAQSQIEKAAASCRQEVKPQLLQRLKDRFRR